MKRDIGLKERLNSVKCVNVSELLCYSKYKNAKDCGKKISGITMKNIFLNDVEQSEPG
jgi:hypothetical protein